MRPILSRHSSPDESITEPFGPVLWCKYCVKRTAHYDGTVNLRHVWICLKCDKYDETELLK